MALKVAMLTYSTRPRGGVVHALKLAERLRSLGVDVTLYSLAKSDDLETAKGFFRKVSVPYRIFSYDSSPELVTRLERMIEAYSANLPRDCDIYHAQDCVGGTALARMKETGAVSAPVFRTIHHIDDFAEPRLFEFEKRAVGHADFRFVVSKYWKDAILCEYGYDSIVTYNGLDEEDFSKLPPRRSSAPTVLFVGGLEPRKGLEYLVRAMANVTREIPDAKLIAVAKTGFRGTDEWGTFEKLATDLGVARSAEFHESVSQDTLLGFYADCDIVVLPSKMEGWGLSLMEGMACGKAVVASRVGGIPELVRDGIDGILVEAGDLEELGQAIVSLLSDDDARARMGRAGKQRVKDFSWDETAKVALEAYKDALQLP